MIPPAISSRYYRAKLSWPRARGQTFPERAARRTLTTEGGSSLIELALLSPVLLLLFAGSVDLGQACYVAIEVSSAANAGAEYGTQNATDIAGMQRAATVNAANLSGLGATASWGCECSDGSAASASCASSPTCSSTTRVRYVTVNTSMTYKPAFGLPGLPSSYVLKGTSTLRATN